MWEDSLNVILETDSADFGNMASILVDLFEGVVTPDIFLTHTNKVAVQQVFSVKMGGSKKLGKLLCQPNIFCSLPTLLQKGILDLLYVILRKGTYDVTRFQYRVVDYKVDDIDSDAMNEDNSQSISLNRVLLDLLQRYSNTIAVSSSQQICEKIIRLLGVTFTAGCTPEDLKEMLRFFRAPTGLTLPLLQALKSIMKQDISMTKASPSAFFSFGGFSSGIYSVFGPFPFTREYQFFTWFRIDKFESSSSSEPGSSSSSDGDVILGRQHIVSVVDSSFNGIDVYIEQNVLNISVSDSKTPATVIRFGSKDVRFTRGVWYHIAVRHAKPRLALFSKDEMAIYIDKILVFQDSVRFPNAAHIGSTSLVCGRNFNGQIGPVYFLNESLPFPAVEAIARLDVGKSVDSTLGTNEGFSAVIAADLLQSIATADRKVVNIPPKFSSVFHPARCKYGHALDVHSGRHAVLGPMTFTWIVHTARDVLESLGGIACLLMMFPKLLIESENAVQYLGPDRYKRNECESTIPENESSTASSVMNFLSDSSLSGLTELEIGTITLLDDSLQGVLEFDYDEASDSGCVGLLLSIIAHTLAGHRSYQRAFASLSAIEMIEFVMKAIPGEVMCGEGDGCILALLQLRSAVADFPTLELRVTKRLICNLAAWTRCTFQFQSSLLSVIATSIRSQPDYFLANLGVQGLLDILRVCFMDGPDVRKPVTPTSTKPTAVSYKTLLPLITSDNNGCESPRSPEGEMRFFSDTNSRGSRISADTDTLPSGTECSPHGSEKKGLMVRKKSLMDLLTDLKDHEDTASKAVEGGDLNCPSADSNGVTGVAQLFMKQVSFDENVSDCSEDGVPEEGVTVDDPDLILSHISNLPKLSSKEQGEDSDNPSLGKKNESDPSFELNVEVPKEPEPVTPTLDRHQRTQLRSSILSMVMSLTQHFSTEREIRPLVHFISSCKDPIVIVEAAQLLLCLLIEGGSKIIAAITEVCGGPEEFAAFIIQRMIKSPSEDLRCLGLRLLTHFYLRVDLLPLSLLSLTMKRRRGSMISRTMEKISMLAGGVGMRRFQACGGFALLEEALTAHSETSGEKTYAALLEMLLSKPSSKSPATVQTANLSEEYAAASASLHLLTNASGMAGSGYVSHRPDSKIAGSALRDRSVIFALSSEQVIEEGIDLTNSIALSFVLDSLPTLPVIVQGKIYRDLLSLLNRSGNNRETFRNNPSWHLSLFSLTSHLVIVNPSPVLVRVSSSDVVKKLSAVGTQEYDWTVPAPSSGSRTKLKIYPDSLPHVPVLNMKKKSQNLSTDMSTDGELSGRSCISPLQIPSAEPSDELKDTWFLSAMEIYCDLFTRAMDMKSGWREVERTLSQSVQGSPLNIITHSIPKYSEMVGSASQRHNDMMAIQREEDRKEAYNREMEAKGCSVARAALSHLISEMTVSIRAKYKDLQRLARSTRFKENQAGLDRMENILTLVLSASQFFLSDVCCASAGVGDLHIGRLRAHYHNEVVEERSHLEALIQQSRASSQHLDQDGVLSDDDPDSPGDCSCIATAHNSRQDGSAGMDRGTFSPGGLGSGSQEFPAPLSLTFSDDMETKGYATRSSNYFDLAEERLTQKYNAGDNYSFSPNIEDISVNAEGMNDNVDFCQSWIAVGAADAQSQAKGSAFQRDVGDGNRKNSAETKKSSSSRSLVTEEMLTTLKRGQDPEEGRLGLVMQTLRLFDAIFWPQRSGALRNKHMLRFIKDQAQVSQANSRTATPGPPSPYTAADSMSMPASSPIIRGELQNQPSLGSIDYPLSAQNSVAPPMYINASTSGLMSPRGPPVLTLNQPSKYAAPTYSQGPSISLYTSVTRMSLNALQALSPLSDVASLNVRRLQELILSQDKVSPYTTPVDDWLLAAVLHVTICLQRVISSLHPVFLKISLDTPLLSVPIMGLENSREFYDAAFQKDDQALSALEADDVMMGNLEKLFDSQEGAALVRYTKDCMQLLLSVVSTRKALLEKALEPRVCDALIQFAERISHDRGCPILNVRASATASTRESVNLAGAATPSSDAAAVIDGATSLTQDLISSSKSDSPRNEAPVAAAVTENTNTRSPAVAPLSRIRGWYRGAGSASEPSVLELPPPAAAATAAEQPIKVSGKVSPINAGLLKDTSNGSRTDADDALNEQNGMDEYARHSLRSESVGSDSDAMSESSVTSGNQGTTAEIQMLNKTYFSAADRHMTRDRLEDGEDMDDLPAVCLVRPIIRWLKLLRDPYTKMNALRSVGVVKSITALEHHEAACAKAFTDDLNSLRYDLEEHRDLSKRSVEEMIELRELSSTIIHSLSSSERTRQSSVRSNDGMLLKKVAANWHDCLSNFEMDWSPLADHPATKMKSGNADADGALGDGKTCRVDGISEYEVSELRDSRMRRMILTRAADPVDHRESAYREGKQRGSLNRDGTTSLRDHSASFTTQRASFLRLDLSKLKNISGAAWGDDSDLNEGQGAGQGGSLDGDTVSTVTTTNQSGREEGMAGGLGGGGMGIIGGLGALVFTSGSTEKRPECSYVFQWAPDERMQSTFTVTQVQLELMISGVLVLTNKALYFHPNKIVGGLSTNKKPLTDHRWHVDRLLEAYGRRFLLQNCAIELFFTDSPEVFFAFTTLTELQQFFRSLKRQNVPNLHASTSRSLDPRMVFANSPWTDLWRRRLISNFEYLMRLNILAGRSYNDITQYPVFPWIIADYTSEVLDLHNPASFRDLSKPVGALNPVRLAEIKERYDSFDNDIMPPFMYGSHYSSAGVVIHYMMRQEPFTTMFVNLQGGKFDCPDRVFFDLKSTWDCCNKDRSDVKELIPELFCCPESLINTSKLPLGELQEGRGVVDDVRLPPWAQGDAFEFVRIHREALESDYVSEHLHEWIDLIFGYKQTGPASVQAHNVFHYLSYENAIDIEAIEDPIDREAAKGHVTHFGQTPAQLTNKEHLPRLFREECMIPLCSDIYNISRLTLFTPPKQLDAINKHGAVISVRSSADRLIVVHEDLTVSYYRWSSFPDGEGSPFQLRPEKFKSLPCSSIAKSEIELKRRSFVPIPPIDSNMQRFPQMNLTTSNSSSSSRRQNGKGDDRIVCLNSDGVSTSQETSNGSRNNNISGKDPSSKAPWSFFGAIRKNIIPSQTNVLTKPSTSEKSESVQHNLELRCGRSEGSVQGSFDDCESDAEYEDDEDSVVQKNDDDSEVEIAFQNSASPRTVQRADILKQLSITSSDASASGVGIPTTQTDGTAIPGVGSPNPPSTKDKPKSPPAERCSQKEKSSFIPLESSKLTEMNSKNIALSVGELGGGRVVSCGYWDNTLKVHSLDSLREIASVNSGHLGEIVCVQLGYQGGHTLITGGSDGTVRVWILENPSLASTFAPDGSNMSNPGSGISASQGISLGGTSNATKIAGGGTAAPPVEGESAHRNDLTGNGPEPSLVCAHVLCGHDSPVTSISYATDLDIVLSGSQSGLLCLHSVRKGAFIRSITHILGAPVDLVLATSPGYLIAHSWSTQDMHVFWINGQHRATVRTATRVETMAVSGPGNVLVCGHTDGRISLRAVWNLQQTHIVTHSSHGAIKCLWFTEDYQFLLIGSADGTVSIGTDPDVRWKLLHAAIQKTPLLGPTL